MMKRLLVSGYKAHELGIFNDQHPGIPIIKKALTDQLLPLLDQGLEWVIVSGQLGVETWVIECVWELQEDYPHLQYAVITPFLDQQAKWNETKQETYEQILALADYTVSLTNKPYEAPWQFVEKNKFLLRNSDALLLLYDEDNEGSPKFLKKMAEQLADTSNYELLTITADDLQLIAEDLQREQWE
ncbi:hypothetical protein SporoP37_03695 [Sporosarcina sp. P37]|uniref:SLOG family protein n=1 Tax=unclassified Sporosarcina TaxID=2647733 RepID=UPI0009BD821C|nr:MULTISPECIES: DUF1273 domain-containing protein [unclassified Sporosarcina]ARD47325.1 hypothetical protein SporoP33_03015 [Sporosarcina sp. P33]ARK23890.1 hypothetical protein SporoP37_03695 [Sporosarcina sp. P37]PID17788.1 DUF1273 domain-containing protein [Sporosarcina sp. P35]